MGALEVLWRWKLKPELATAGALLMVLSLTIDPLAQQLLTYPIIRREAPDESAYVQTTHGYTAPIIEKAFDLLSPANQVFMGLYVDPNMLRAILSGLSQSSSPLEPICLTGDCDYPDFTSLGICSNCEDVTTKATQVCEMMTIDHALSIGPGWDIPALDLFPKSMPLDCTYTSPSGFKIKPQLFHEFSPGDNDIHFYRQPWTSISKLQANFSVEPMISFLSAKYEQDLYYTLQNATTWEQKPILTECSIDWCETRYTNNSYNSTGQRGLSGTKSQILREGDCGLVPFNGSNISNESNGNCSQSLAYTVDTGTILLLPRVLGAIFNSTLSATSENNTSAGDPTLFLYLSQNLTSTIAQMATAMTDLLRSTAGPTTSHIRGMAYDERAIIHVRWGWITVPFASVIMAAFLLIATAISSRKLNTVLWKSSVLPLLFGHLQTWPEHDLASLPPHVSQITDISKKIGIVTEKSHPPVMVEA